MLVSLDAKGPLHRQIYRAFRGAILSGRLSAGSRIPSSRAQARLLGVSRNVVLQAYDQLAAEGYLDSRTGSGTFVCEDLPEAMLRTEAERRDKGSLAGRPRFTGSAYGRRAAAVALRSTRSEFELDFAYGLARPDDTTLRQWQRRLRLAAERLPLDYGAPRGEPALREALAAYLYRSRGIVAEADRILIVNGSQQALSLTARVLLDPGDRILIEEPSYQGARQIFLTEGLSLQPVPLDDQGLNLAALPEGTSGRAAYVTPSHQFPTGVTMPLSRRLALLGWARRHRGYVVEDDYDSEYRYEGRPLEAIQSLDREGRVIYVGTFSKVLFPALRLGFLVLPEAQVPAFERAKWLTDRQSPSLEQRVLAEFLVSGEFEQHLRRARTRNAQRRTALLEALDRYLGGSATVSGPSAGIHLVVWLGKLPPPEVDERIRRAAERGVGLYSVAPYFFEPTDRGGLLLGYSNLEESEIWEGVRRVAPLFR